MQNNNSQNDHDSGAVTGTTLASDYDIPNDAMEDDERELELLRLEALSAKRSSQGTKLNEDKSTRSSNMIITFAKNVTHGFKSVKWTRVYVILENILPGRFRRYDDKQREDEENDDRHQDESSDQRNDIEGIEVEDHLSKNQASTRLACGTWENDRLTPVIVSTAEPFFEQNYRTYRVECSRVMSNDAYEPDSCVVSIGIFMD